MATRNKGRLVMTLAWILVISFSVMYNSAIIPSIDSGDSAAETLEPASPYSSNSEDVIVNNTTDDVDGDRLTNRDEMGNSAIIQNSDPINKDIYIQINYAKGVEPLSETEKNELKQIWSEMPVDNPSGSTGITIHIDDTPPYGGTVEERVKYNFSRPAALRSDGEWFNKYKNYVPDRRQCTYHLVLLVHSNYNPNADNRSKYIAGFADTPGYFLVVDGQKYRTAGKYQVRPQIITHELLHNIVGQIGEDGHTDDGWLSQSGDEYLSKEVAEQINENGLDTTDYYRQVVC